MSEGRNVVFTFRLNTRNPRELKALEYLEARKARGYPTRDTIADALARMADAESARDEVLQLQQEALDILRRLDAGEIHVTPAPGQAAQGEELSAEFKANLKKLARPLRRTGESED